MKQTGHYSPVDCEYDLDHEINDKVNAVDNLIDGIDSDANLENRTKIIKAMISHLVEKI